jgi:formate/nitrite transporter FocA (FNT family)
MHRKNLATLKSMMRLWTVVFAGNLIGAALFACYVMCTNAFDEPVRRQFLELGHAAMEMGFSDMIVRGVLAGWMIALMVWLMPFAEAARFFVIVTITYVVGLANLSHVIAGAAEAFTTAAAGERSWWEPLRDFVLPSLVGNTVGGVTLVAALNHAQVVAGADGPDA